MKILLISVQNTSNRYIEEPGISYIASYLEQYNHSVKVVPFYYKSKSIDEIVNEQPKLIGMSTYDRFFEYELGLAKRIKELLPDAKLYIGGYVASYHGMEVMDKFNFIDYAIVGEGEKSTLDLILALEGKKTFEDVGGLIYRDKKGNLQINNRSDLICDLNCLPYMNRDILKRSNSNFVQLSTSRGCTGACSFCCSSEFWRDSKKKRVYRSMNPKRVVDEIEYVVKNYKKNCFCFNDNSFEDPGPTYYRQKAIAEEIISRNLKISYVINCKTNFYKTADSELMELLIKSGLISIFLGVEAGNDNDLLLYNKRCTVEENNNSIAYFSSFNDLSVNIGFINFNSYTNINKLRANNEFLYKNSFLGDFGNISSKFKPFRGVKLYYQVEQDGLLTGNIESGGYDCDYMNPTIGKLEQYINRCYEKYNILNDSSYLCGKFSQIVVPHILKCAKWDDEIELVNYIVDFKKRYNDIMLIINELMHGYLGALITLLEKKWQIEFADNITEQYFENQGMYSFYQKLAKMRFSFCKYILEYYSQYKNYL